MADAMTPNSTNDQDGFAASVSRALTRHLLVSLSAAGATAATAYLVRKGRELWDERAVPAINERGGAETVAKEAVARASDLVAGVVTRVGESEQVSALTDRVERVTQAAPETEPLPESTSSSSDTEREKERRARRKRREERQAALKSSGSS